MKRIILNILFVSFVLVTCAQELQVQAPSHVSTGENFRLSYVISTQDVGDIHLGGIPSALELITGPYRSSQSSYQIVNGHASSSSSTTFTFILCATKSGTYKIPAATVVANGHKYTSRALQVKVSGKSTNGNSAPKMHDSSDDIASMRPAGTSVKGSDLFIKVSANKKSVYEQEPVLLTYKVYTLVDLSELKGDMPDLTGFHTLEVPMPQQKSFHVEQLDGRPYKCVTWSQYVMYPQMSGSLKIPSIVFKGTVVQQNRDIDPFEAFFNGGAAYVEVKRDIVAPGLTLQVNALPQRPANFSGGVGVFNISAQLNKTDIKTNDPFSLRVVVSGQGNMKLLKQPVVKFPKDFDKYDPKITDKTKISTAGLGGNMIYDFVAVPRNQGKYTIPAIEFTYFDTQSKSYKTLKTQPFEIEVGKGTGDNTSVSDYASDLKAKDIKPIKEGEANIQDLDNMFFNSPVYWMIVGLIVVLSAVSIYGLRKYISLGSDTVRNKRRMANRVAFKRLRQANDSMLKGKRELFYEDVLKAMWGYAEEKFNLPAGQLTRGNVEQTMCEKGISEDVAAEFIEIIDHCEMERYSPSSEANNMNEIFEKAMNTITAVDNAMKKSASKSFKTVLLAVLLMSLALPSYPITKSNADTEYRKGNYQQAIKDYNELLKKGNSAEIYYNLGNAYYRTDNITYAILSYERALLLSPSDKDIQLNLQLAQSKTIDKITPEPRMFLVKWYKSLVNLVNVDTWAVISLASLFIAFVLFTLYLVMGRVLVRKIGFFGSILFLLLFIMSNLCAYQQKWQFENRCGAIVIAPSLQMKSVPADKGANVAVIHEGTRVDIIDDSMKEWKQVRLGDNREGWVKVSNIEKI